ncbi:uncharacterized protein C8A04DRAFT_27164 [Dichotomopilus funicola]|uniref:Uncharacterized protein n=1 Tax=Dichotomopilus funicola TaxID=1934379 RepID=A0AAN6V639_9PEZI|nr:hypothetical protein C8A04DRAFT_27164 [Dichotomopilus funicola]
MGHPPADEPPNTTSTTALPPPSYSEATTTPSYLPSPTSTLSNGLPPASPLTTHLRALPARFRTARLARQSAQAADELGLAALLVPHVEGFLAELTAAGGGLAGSSSASFSGPAWTRRGTASGIRGELTLVPVGVVPNGARMSGLEERIGDGEVVRVGFVDVAVEEEGGGFGEKGGEKKGGTNRNGDGNASGGALREQVNTGFDEWGRFDTHPSRSDSDTNGWWFRDEDMARRLATYLRPEPVLERKRVQATVVQAKTVEKEKSGWSRWGLGGGGRKRSTSSVGSEQMSPGLPSPISPVLSSPVLSAEDDAVRMAVTAQEVTFRKENDFGVWESLTGWGVVVAVRISA